MKSKILKKVYEKGGEEGEGGKGSEMPECVGLTAKQLAENLSR